MQIDFHYYATYCAALLAGWPHEDSLAVATAAQYVDCCTRTALKKMRAPANAATTQSQMEMMDAPPGLLSLQDITRIWASFHFLPGDLYAKPSRRTSRVFLHKFRLICHPNSALLRETVELARKDGSLQAAGIAMHILADTWAHRYFAGSPSMVINNVNAHFFESIPAEGAESWEPIHFRHKVSGPDDLENRKYTASLLQYNETSVMNLGHGRVGHLPDYSFMKYRYLPAWGDYAEIIKDNPQDYIHAFAQMIYALKSLRKKDGSFRTDEYDWDALAPVRERVESILRTRQLDASADWKALGEQLSGEIIPDFSDRAYEEEYLAAPASGRDNTAPGRFILAALRQKSMVTRRIFESGSLLAGFSADYLEKGLAGIRDYQKLAEQRNRRADQ